MKQIAGQKEVIMRILNILLMVTLMGITGCESQQDAQQKPAANYQPQIGRTLQSDQSEKEKSEAKELQETNDLTPVALAANADRTKRLANGAVNVSGEVMEFHQSPDGDVDGVNLKDGTEVRFPSQAAEKVTATIFIGNQVEISGWMHSGESELHAATITDVGSGIAIDVDEPPPNR